MSMSQCNELAASLMSGLWRASWQGGLFVAAVWLICRLAPRLSPQARYWLWWIASLQMLFRIAIVSPIALPILPSSPIGSAQSARTTTSPALIEEPASRVTPKETPMAIPTSAERPLARAADVQPTLPTGASLLMALWILGIGVGVGTSVRRLVRTRRLLEKSKPIGAGRLADIVDEFSADFGMRRPRLVESDEAICPLLAGWLRPTIVMPPGSGERFAEPQLRMAIAHEFAHLRRKDLWLGIVPALAQSVFFFHPLAWLASHECSAAQEVACDSEALRLSGGSPAAYARLLLDSAQARSSMAVLGAAFGFRSIQRRISMLKSLTGTSSRQYRIGGTLLIAFGAICALPWSVTAQQPPATTAPAAKHATKPATSHKAIAKKTKPAKPAVHRSIQTPSTRTQPSAAMPPRSIGLAVEVPVVPAMPIAPPSRTRIAGAPTPVLIAPSGSTTVVAETSRQDTILTPAMPSPAHTQSEPPRTALPVAAFPPSVASTQGESGVSFGEGTMKIHFDHVPIHQALQELFEGLHVDYVISSDVEDKDKVTCSLRGVPLERALNLILKSVNQPLIYEIENDVYTIRASKAQH